VRRDVLRSREGRGGSSGPTEVESEERLRAEMTRDPERRSRERISCSSRRMSSFATLGMTAALAATLSAQDTTRFTHADTLRGSIGPGRNWWGVAFYDLHV